MNIYENPQIGQKVQKKTKNKSKEDKNLVT